ncbi:unnamed protein product [Alopecurus aequalis]
MSELSSIPTILSKGKVARALYSPRLFFSVFVVFSGALKPSRKKTRKHKIGTEEYRMELLAHRVRQVTPWNVPAIVSQIIGAKTPEEIDEYLNGPDADIHALVDATKKSMVPSAVSRRHEYEFPALVDATKKSTVPSAVSQGREFPAPSWNSQGQSSDAFEGFQAASTGQIGTSQHPGSSSVPDDGTSDFPHPSWNSQAQSSGTSVGIQSATAGQIVTLQNPDDKSIGLNEHSQSSSVPSCSNITGYLPSTSRLWSGTCYFYISRHGLWKNGLSCRFSHGFGPSGTLEMQIRQLLLRVPHIAVSVQALSWMYSECYNMLLPVRNIWHPHSIPTLLRPLHTICLVSHRHGQHSVVLLERYQAYIRYSGDRRYREVLEEEGPNQIYISFPAGSQFICTRENVYRYFRQYGHVLYVNIPHQSSFGFVRFQYPRTVRLLLSEWNPQVPHFIFEAAVRVRRYIPKDKLKNTAGKLGLENGCNPGIVTGESSGTGAPEIAPPPTHSQPSDSQMEIIPLEGGEAAGSPGGDSADNSQPSHSQLEIDHIEGGEVPGGLEINPFIANPGEDGLGVNPVQDEPALHGLGINPIEDGLVPVGLGINPVEGGQVPVDLAGDPADGQVLGDLAGDPADVHVPPGDLDEDPADEHIVGEIVTRLPDVSCFYKQT